MTVDLLGPANAANAVTVRPADARVFGTSDTFFQDCSSPSAKDGTRIMAAFLNGLLQQTRRAIRGMGITENNTSDDMLLNAILAGRDYYIIDAPTPKTVHGVGADFADLNAAFEWVSKYRITKNGSVTFNVAAGQFTYSTPITFAHANGDRISIVGANLPGAAPTSGNFVGTGTSSGARTTDAGNNLTMLRGKYSTELHFTGANNITINGNIGLVDKLLITGDGTSATGVVANLGAVAKFGAVSLHGWGLTGGTGNGIYVSSGLLAITTCLTASGCGGSGIVFANYANCTPAGGAIIAYGNGGNGLSVNAGWELDPNASAGVTACSYNAGHGCFVNQGQITATAGSTFSNNGANGLTVSFGSANAQNCHFDNNAATGVTATNRGIAVITGSSTNTNGVAAISPSPQGTVGNSNSVVIN